MKLPSILVANRGEIAVRVLRACRELGVRGVAVYTDADADAMHVRVADDAVRIDGESLADTYLNGAKLVEAALAAGVAAVHPGYGFLSENAAFCRQVVEAGLVFVGPPAEAIEMMGDKMTARIIAERCNASPVPGTFSAMADAQQLKTFAEAAGYPVVIKAAFGGGGRGMRVVETPEEAADALEAARREAETAFGRGEVYVERYFRRPRHIEVQLLADQAGTVVACGTRDCSVQRRHQKVLEEAPAVGLAVSLIAEMEAAAKRLAVEVGYIGAGTVEFLVEDDKFYFLEMNTRIQVEHPVTEEVAGIDLVGEQIRIASGLSLRSTESDMRPRGHAIELRINAEDLIDGQLIPSPGVIGQLVVPHLQGVRWDAGYENGDVLSGSFDNLIGKLVVWGVDRPSAIQRARDAVEAMRITGVGTTLPVHQHVLAHEAFRELQIWTGWLEAEGLSGVAVAEMVPEGPADTDESADGDSTQVWIGDYLYSLPPIVDAGQVVGVRGPTAAPAVSRQAVSRPVPPARSARSGPTKAVDGALVCPMQGTVVAIKVEVGATVTRGEVVAVVESMKMENAVKATRDGQVSEIHAAVGNAVGRGDLLITLERES